MRLFADDCLVYRKVTTRDDQLQLQKDLDEVTQWCATWGMKINTSKCNILRITRAAHPIQSFYTLSGDILKEVQHTKYLGITISNTLKWSDHISWCTKKASSKLGFIQRNLKRCPYQLKPTAYCSLVRAGLEYSAAIWDSHQPKDVDLCERIQRRAARFVAHDYNRTSVNKLLEELNWQPLTSRREALRLSLLYKITHGLVAVDPTEVGLVLAGQRTRSAHKYKYRAVAARTDSYRYSMVPRTIAEWNRLPPEVVDAPSADCFMSRIRGVQSQ